MFSALVESIRKEFPLSTYIGQYVVLQRKGQIFLGLCPFHGEKTPSFNVHDIKGRYHCFGCGATGDLFDFAQHYLGLSFREALENFCHQGGFVSPYGQTFSGEHNHIKRQSRPQRKIIDTQNIKEIKKNYHNEKKETTNSIESSKPQEKKDHDQRSSDFSLGSIKKIPFIKDASHGIYQEKNPQEKPQGQFPKKSLPSLNIQNHKEKLYVILDLVRLWAHHKLFYSSQGEKALEYLEKKRHISRQAALVFSLGYIPPEGLRELRDFFHFSPEDLHEAGLLRKNPQGAYHNLFRHRLMFPIWDTYGRCVAFGGRDLQGDIPQEFHGSIDTQNQEKKGLHEGFSQSRPKYLNSPLTSLFLKHNTLYGLPRSSGFFGKKVSHFLEEKIKTCPEKTMYYGELLQKQQIQQEALVTHGPAIYQEKILFVVEGYVDVIALFDVGFWGVAPLGTAMGEHQLQEIWKYHNEPIVCFDGDAPGLKAAKRLAYLAIGHLCPGKTLKFLPLDKGFDPHSYLTKDYMNQSPEERFLFAQYQEGFRGKIQKNFQDLAKNALPLWRFLHEDIFTGGSPEIQAKQQEQWEELLAKIPHGHIEAQYRSLGKKLQEKVPLTISLHQEKWLKKSQKPREKKHNTPWEAPKIFFGQQSPDVLTNFYCPEISKDFIKDSGESSEHQEWDLSKTDNFPFHENTPSPKEEHQNIPRISENFTDFHNKDRSFFQGSLKIQNPKDCSLSQGIPQDIFGPFPYGLLLFLSFSYDFLCQNQEESLEILWSHHKNFFSQGESVVFSQLDPLFQQEYKKCCGPKGRLLIMLWEFMIYYKNRQKIHIILTPDLYWGPSETSQEEQILCASLPSFFQCLGFFYYHFPLEWPRPFSFQLSFSNAEATKKCRPGVLMKAINAYWQNLWNTYMTTCYQRRDIEALKIALQNPHHHQGDKHLWERLKNLTNI